VLNSARKNSEHSRKYERYKRQRTGDGGTEDGKQRNKGQEQWNRATEKETLGQSIGLRRGKSRIGDGTDHLRQRTKEDERQVTET
jgi:hypothetical protein